MCCSFLTARFPSQFAFCTRECSLYQSCQLVMAILLFLLKMLINIRQLDPFGLWTVDGYFLVLLSTGISTSALSPGLVSRPLNV